MLVCDKLFSISSSSMFIDFVDSESLEIRDFFSLQNDTNLLRLKSELTRGIFNILPFFNSLDISEPKHFRFLILLIEYSIRFQDPFLFERCFNSIPKYKLSNKIIAAHILMIRMNWHINNYTDYLNEFFLNLKKSYSDEKETINAVVWLAGQWYLKIILDFAKSNNDAVLRFRDQARSLCQLEDYSFLNTELFQEILSVDIENIDFAIKKIQNLITKTISSSSVSTVVSEHHLLVESNTNYAKKLSGKSRSWPAIVLASRELLSDRSLEHVDNIKWDSDLFESLNHGVDIYKEENQLLKYISSYHNMHVAKVVSGIKVLPPVFFNNNIQIIDWGAGQALASCVFLNYLLKKNINQKIISTILIEPSEIAIKRGVLHLRHIDNSQVVIPVHKDLNSLKTKDFKDSDDVKLHFFSNILDVEGGDVEYSLAHLIDIVKTSFSGVNYFIVVSPFYGDASVRSNKLEYFVDAFRKDDSFDIFLDERNSPSNNPWTILPKKTRNIKVFRVCL